MEPDSSHPFSTHHTWYMSQPRTVKTPCALYVSIYYLTTVNPSLHALTCMHMYAIHTTPHYANIDDVSGRQSVIPFLFLFCRLNTKLCNAHRLGDHLPGTLRSPAFTEWIADLKSAQNPAVPVKWVLQDPIIMAKPCSKLLHSHLQAL